MLLRGGCDAPFTAWFSVKAIIPAMFFCHFLGLLKAPSMKHASLFTGIGGFDLAAKWMGWENVFQVELDMFCHKVLQYHFPDAKRYTDIRGFEGARYRGTIDIISGGFPCQPFSVAGKRLGSDDARHLWPAMFKVIRDVQPRWVVGENVRGLVNWSRGLVFEQVCADLETAGYQVQPFLLPACGINAPHKRERIWIVANTAGIRCESNLSEWQRVQRPEPACRKAGTGHFTEGGIANAYNMQWREVAEGPEEQHVSRVDGQAPANAYGHLGRERRNYQAESKSSTQNSGQCHAWATREIWANFPAEPPLCSADDGLPRHMDGITFSKWRSESLKCYGNAVVPALVYQIFKAIELYDSGACASIVVPV